jgi:hypothetical protein
MSSVPILGPRLSWVEKPMRMVPHTQPARSAGLLLGMRLEFARCAERRSEKMPFSLISFEVNVKATITSRAPPEVNGVQASCSPAAFTDGLLERCCAFSAGTAYQLQRFQRTAKHPQRTRQDQIDRSIDRTSGQRNVHLVITRSYTI